MADRPLTVQISKTVSDALIDEPHAPFVFFDTVASHGQMPGIIMACLAGSRMLPDAQGNIHTKPVPVAYLRTNVRGAQELIGALQQALAMAAAAQDGPPGTAN